RGTEAAPVHHGENAHQTVLTGNRKAPVYTDGAERRGPSHRIVGFRFRRDARCAAADARATAAAWCSVCWQQRQSTQAAQAGPAGHTAITMCRRSHIAAVRADLCDPPIA